MKLYEACSFEDDYADLLASTIAGETELVYEQFLTHGQKCIGVQPTRRSNPKIEYSARKFSMILKDYSNWKAAWWREVIQNSVDAGANEVRLSSKKADEAKIAQYAGYASLPSLSHLGSIDITDCYVVSCLDTAGGMDEDTLFGKFLTLGATGKEGIPGSVGGFGIAKELILLPWIVWSVHTRNKLVVGRGLDYEVMDASYLEGTFVEVIMPKDVSTHTFQAVDVISKSSIPNVTFEVISDQGSSIHRADMAGSKLISKLPGDLARIYHKPGADSYQVLVRVAGPKGTLYMFPIGVGIKLPGNFLADIDGTKSTEYLSTNRDGFSAQGSVVNAAVQEIVVRAAKDVLSFARLFASTIKKIYEADPTQKLIVNRYQADAVAQLKPLGDLDSLGIEVMVENIDNVTSEMLEEERIRTEEQALQGKAIKNYQTEPANKDTIQIALGAVINNGQDSLETAVKQLVWRPDFAVISEIPGYIPPADFFLETMSARAVRLIKVWTELCRFVLIALNYSGPFGVGYLFSNDTQAAYLPNEGGSGDVGYLMLNPFRAKGKVWHPQKDLDWLWAAAVHECTHMIDKLDTHDEAFAAALTWNIAKTRRYFKQAKRIAASIGLKEGLSAADAKRASTLMRKEVEKQRIESIREGIRRTGIIPDHTFVEATRGRKAKTWENAKCMLCGVKRGKHV